MGRVDKMGHASGRGLVGGNWYRGIRYMLTVCMYGRMGRFVLVEVSHAREGVVDIPPL